MIIELQNKNQDTKSTFYQLWKSQKHKITDTLIKSMIHTDEQQQL